MEGQTSRGSAAEKGEDVREKERRSETGSQRQREEQLAVAAAEGRGI